MNTENNRIIAEFLGCYEDKNGYWGFKHTKEHERWHHDRFLNATFYDKDWNDLMLLVQEITTTTEFHTDYPNNNIFWESYNQIDKQKIYNACVEFIKWYNQQKQN